MSPGVMVLDASALLAAMLEEPGQEKVERALPNAIIGSVNLVEVASRLIDGGLSPEEAEEDLAALELTVIDFDQAQAIEAARLRALTRHAGLSLGDRACLALALVRGVPVLTADRAWAALAEAIGVEVELVR
ncbi:type II toxin-antitoxin system VapC family toxin [Sandarakinorhabdus sp.]|uniref:type II toxin-antitoxin system VapC family toxin n=1 Tax=Sandarakinorhabdus sp. TaxID=1916663 RepID=UPI0033400B98